MITTPTGVEPARLSDLRRTIMDGIDMLINGQCDAITPSQMVDRELVKWHRGRIAGNDLAMVVWQELPPSAAHNIICALGL